jgi:hypothetical protein
LHLNFRCHLGGAFASAVAVPGTADLPIGSYDRSRATSQIAIVPRQFCNAGFSAVASVSAFARRITAGTRDAGNRSGLASSH